MLSSLRARLLAVVVAVGVVAIGATAAISQQVAANDLRDALSLRLDTRAEVLDALTSQVQAAGNWDGVDATVQALADQFRERVAVVDDDGQVIADSSPGAELPPWPTGSIELASDGGVVTSGLVFVGVGGDAVSVLGRNGPNWRLVVVAVGVLLVAMVVMAFALRPVLAPIGALRSGARRLEDGHLNTRVPETGARELASLARSFNSMAAALQADQERQRRWTSDTAHELRNPVQNLRGHLEAARDGLMIPDDEWLDSMLEDVGQLGHLVSDLSVLTLSDAGQVALEREPLRLRSVVDDVVTSHRPRAERAEIILTAVGSSEIEVDGDARRLRQVISNLVDNALRHTPAGGSVTVEIDHTGETATLRVIDTGDGIPVDAQDRIFDRFARVDEHRARHAGGTGLGLSIVAALVDAHGGQVSVESEEGIGSTFTFTLPTTEPPTV